MAKLNLLALMAKLAQCEVVVEDDFFSGLTTAQKSANTNKVGKGTESSEAAQTTKGGSKNPSTKGAKSKTTKGSSKSKSSTKGGKDKNPNRLAPVEFKKLYAINLEKVGKISKADVEKSQKDDNYSTELYKKFKDTVKFSNAEALALKGTLKPEKPITKSDKVAYGKIKVGDFFKVMNLKTNKPVAVGVAKSICEADKTVTAESGKKFLLENCVAINQKTFAKLNDKFNKKAKKQQINPVDYKLVYAMLLREKDKISDQDLAKAKSSNDYARELYSQFKSEITLSNDEALERFAALSAAKAA